MVPNSLLNFIFLDLFLLPIFSLLTYFLFIFSIVFQFLIMSTMSSAYVIIYPSLLLSIVFNFLYFETRINKAIDRGYTFRWRRIDIVKSKFAKKKRCKSSSFEISKLFKLGASFFEKLSSWFSILSGKSLNLYSNMSLLYWNNYNTVTDF